MGSRKQSKPNPKAEAESELPALPEIPKTEGKAPPGNNTEPAVSSEASQNTRTASSTDTGTTTPRSTWYGGTWPRGNKAASVTQVVKESISASGGAACELVAQALPDTSTAPLASIKNPAPYLSRSLGSSTRSLPLVATTTRLNITSNSSSNANGAATVDREPQKDDLASNSQNVNLNSAVDKLPGKDDTEIARKERPAPEDSSMKETESRKPISEGSAGNDTSTWLGWFSKPAQSSGQNPIPANNTPGNGEVANVASQEHSDFQACSSQNGKLHEGLRRNSDPNPVPVAVQKEQQSRSWLSLWSSTNVNSEKSTAAIAAESVSTTPSKGAADTKKLEQRSIQPADTSSLPSQTSPQAADTSKSQGWSFWSKGRSSEGLTSSFPKNNVGKLAVSGPFTQLQPEDAVVDLAKGLPSKLGKRERPQSLEVTDDTASAASQKVDTELRQNIKATKLLPVIKTSEQTSAKPPKPADNLLLPPFKRTYRIPEKPSLLQHLSRILQYTQIPNTKHLDLVSSAPRIRRALAIGIHGYFPAPLIRSVLGQPTGTSIRFANSAASAIQRWTQNHGYTCEIEKVALEGEGKIAERIDLLWKLMLNWIEKIRKADFVMIACHSQGVPVAISLVAKLISFGCVNAAKIGICAMAGVNMGPFADYKSRWIGGSAGELFEFARPESQVSKDYEAALEAALKFGVKIVYIGSIDDQLVSLESSTFGIINHPHIYRAVFIDGRVHAPDFLTHLVGFALKLRNLGISDHGLIRELSSPLAGSLYGGEGHSRIYDDDSVYYLAVEHALETSSLDNTSPKIQHDGTGASQNPYILPFAIRGLLEEEYVRTELAHETAELLRQFDDWKPSSKVLKDVKFRLEGVRSKL